jgi:Zn-finger nucleic acid-binding protein
MLRCPSCSAGMVPDAVAGVQTYCCPACAGLWVGVDELRGLAGRHGGGAGLRFTPTADGPLYSCPGCSTGTLRAGSVASYQVMACNHCGGAFLPALPPPRAEPPVRAAVQDYDGGSGSLLLEILVDIGAALA